MNKDFNYKQNGKSLIKKCKILFNGLEVVSENYQYFHNIHSLEHFKCNNQTGLCCYSFSLNPLELQPSGSCNMSFIKNNKLLFSVDIDKKVNGESVYLSKEYVLNCYCLNYNILRISNGSGQLVFK